MNVCKNCKGPFNIWTNTWGKRKPIFCSIICWAEYQKAIYIKLWKEGKISGRRGNFGGVSYTIRKYLFKKYHNACRKCKWSKINKQTGKIPLEIHHKDGNSQNCSENNLDLLCPNCHSLTPNFRALNTKGNGRKR